MNAAASRRIELVKMLSNSEVPVGSEQLGKVLGVNRRTIERDIIKLEELGYKFNKKFGPGGGVAAIRPIPDLDYILCENDTENAHQFRSISEATDSFSPISIIDN